MFWRTDAAEQWHARSREVAAATACDPDRLWRWCAAFAAVLAASRAIRGADPARIVALPSIAP